MTKPRLSVERELFGIIGTVKNPSALQASWNAYFAKNNIDAFIDKYPTDAQNIQERLSEMYSFDRRMYIVGPSLQSAVLPHLDVIHDSVKKFGICTIVYNRGGVLYGLYVDIDFENFKIVEEAVEKLIQ